MRTFILTSARTVLHAGYSYHDIDGRERGGPRRCRRQHHRHDLHAVGCGHTEACRYGRCRDIHHCSYACLCAHAVCMCVRVCVILLLVRIRGFVRWKLETMFIFVLDVISRTWACLFPLFLVQGRSYFLRLFLSSVFPSLASISRFEC